MSSQLCLSIRFLDPLFHGRGDGGHPEWPPSPLRVVQSLVAAAAARRRGEALATDVRAALSWLEEQELVAIVAPPGVQGSGYRSSVPNNAMDLVAKAWCRGDLTATGDANPATHRTMKTIRPTWMRGGDAVHYLWPLPDPLTGEVRGHIDTLCQLARSVIALGWGVDMVVGHGALVSEEEAAALAGERWLPTRGATNNNLRVPVRGTLPALLERHERFLARLGPSGFAAPPPLTAYARVGYRRAFDPPLRQVAAFSLLKLDASGFRAFDTSRRALTVAGMLRHATVVAAERTGWDKSAIDTFVLGHGESKNGTAHVVVGPRRFAYLPLPSIESRGRSGGRVVGEVRRVLLTAYDEGCETEMAWARRTLSGQELIPEGQAQPAALLSLLPATDSVVCHYTRTADSWATVTPVVLPGYDDPAHYRRRLQRGIAAEEQKQLLRRLAERIDGLLRKAIVQAGFSRELADHAELEWRRVGFWPGAEPAERYGVPGHLRRFPRLHVKLQWRDAHGNPTPIAGPVCIGGGRFFGLGLFAAMPNSEARSSHEASSRPAAPFHDGVEPEA